MSSGLKVEGVIWAKAGGPVSSESIPAGRAQRQGGGEAWKPAGLWGGVKERGTRRQGILRKHGRCSSRSPALLPRALPALPMTVTSSSSQKQDPRARPCSPIWVRLPLPPRSDRNPLSFFSARTWLVLSPATLT